jgi:hypothetical protein
MDVGLLLPRQFILVMVDARLNVSSTFDTTQRAVVYSYNAKFSGVVAPGI